MVVVFYSMRVYSGSQIDNRIFNADPFTIGTCIWVAKER